MHSIHFRLSCDTQILSIISIYDSNTSSIKTQHCFRPKVLQALKILGIFSLLTAPTEYQWDSREKSKDRLDLPLTKYIEWLKTSFTSEWDLGIWFHLNSRCVLRILKNSVNDKDKQIKPPVKRWSREWDTREMSVTYFQGVCQYKRGVEWNFISVWHCAAETLWTRTQNTGPLFPTADNTFQCRRRFVWSRRDFCTTSAGRKSALLETWVT